MTSGNAFPSARYGVHSEVGTLRKVLVCAPGRAHERLTPGNCDDLLFDDVLWVQNARRDHFDFMSEMRQQGVEVVELHSLLAEISTSPRPANGCSTARSSPTRSAWVFQNLAVRKPELDAGVYAYAKAGFGTYPGFLSAFGYWASACVGNVTYRVLIKSTLGAVFPALGDGDTLLAVAISSVGLWAFAFLILRGVREAAGINTIVTIAKIVPLVTFVVILSYGVLPRADLAEQRQPSVAGVLESVVGPWGALFISIGVIVSVLGAYLAWTLMAAEVLFVAAEHDDMPRFLSRLNAKDVPAPALLLTSGLSRSCSC
ncbi:amino acid permease [Pseudonocardia sp.]|uniref:amino acid permease n=1 Tax=Pseudonocardia sp. TaxID=60912 RepID=UPI003D14ACAD